MSLTPPGSSASTYTYDALGRVATRSTGAATLTYRYVGSGHVSYATLPGTGAATYALVDAAESRLALDTGGVTAWTVFDLHANLAATQAEASSALVGALRYDAWGQTLDAWSAASGATEVPWRFQGRLDLSPDPDEPLYDYGARRYRPSAAAFTQLDTYAGRAVDPLSLNRFLYAHANPTTLVDPDGHRGTRPGPMIDGEYVNPGYKTSAAPPAPHAGPSAPNAPRLEAIATSSTGSAGVRAPSFSVIPIDLLGPIPIPFEDSHRFLAQVSDEYFPWDAAFTVEPDRRHLAQEAYMYLTMINGSEELAFDQMMSDFGFGTAMEAKHGSENYLEGLSATAEVIGPLDHLVIGAGVVKWGVSRLRSRTAPWLFAGSPGRPNPVANALFHWNKHRGDFTHLQNSLEYVREAHAFTLQPPPGSMIKTRPLTGQVVIFHPPSGRFAVRNAVGEVQTYFKPDPGVHRRPTNQDYFDDQ